MKNKYWIILSLLLIFAAGLAGGILLVKFFSPQAQEERERRPPHFPSLDKLAHDLGLTVRQKDELQDIFKRNEEKFRELRTRMHEELQEIRAQLKKEIDGVLTPEQRQKLEALIARQVSGHRNPYDRREGFTPENRKGEDKGEQE